MSSKKPAPRPKLSFAVDREEIDISSDWVQAVMGPGEIPTATVEEETPVAEKSARHVRPKPIRRITDGLTPAQFTLYRLMYDQGEPLAEGVRLYRGGYVDLCRLTGLSKRGVQNVVAELQKKGAIAIHQAPGYHRTQTTVYRVLVEGSVMDSWTRKGLRYALGKGRVLLRKDLQ